MRYMIHDQGRFIVKDTKENAQCPYLNRRTALVALTDGIGKSEIETLSREVLNHAPDVELREQVRILRTALVDLCDSQLSSRDRESAIGRGLAALEATKEGA